MSDFQDLPPHARVWIYQSTRELTPAEVEQIQKRSAEFVEQWTSHNQLMHAGITVFHNRFIVACVDEKTAPASGCGIDKSVKFIQSLEKEFNTTLLDRMQVAYRKNGIIHTAPLAELINTGGLTVFNNLVSTKEEFEKNWEVPLEKSWHKQFIS